MHTLDVLACSAFVWCLDLSVILAARIRHPRRSRQNNKEQQTAAAANTTAATNNAAAPKAKQPVIPGHRPVTGIGLADSSKEEAHHKPIVHKFDKDNSADTHHSRLPHVKGKESPPPDVATDNTSTAARNNNADGPHHITITHPSGFYRVTHHGQTTTSSRDSSSSSNTTKVRNFDGKGPGTFEAVSFGDKQYNFFPRHHAPPKDNDDVTFGSEPSSVNHGVQIGRSYGNVNVVQHR